MAKYASLSEFFSGLERYSSESGADPWAAYKERFLNLPSAGRAHELACFDELLEEEHRVTKEHAEYITKRRELSSLDSLLRRGGR